VTLHENYGDAARETAADLRAQVPALVVVTLVHVLVPAALILLVIALLDFLLAVRGVLIEGGTVVFRWVLICFVSASVLIVRHSRVDRGSGSLDPIVYLIFLGVSTSFTLLWVSPVTGPVFGNPESDFAVGLLNLGTVCVVWWLATALARQMCLEGIGKTAHDADAIVHYGDSYREWQERKDWVDEPPAEESPRKPAPKPETESALKTLLMTPFRAVFGEISLDAHGNPARGVARLVVLVLIGCALSEPLLLLGEPGAGLRALAALLVFLLSAGTLLAIGSVAGVAHHAALAGGEMAVTTIALRAGVGLAFTVVVLSITLLLPGLRFAGSGDIRGDFRGQGTVEVEHERDGGAGNEVERARRASQGPAPPSLPGTLVALGRVLILPAAILLVVGTVWVLWRLKLDWGALFRGGLKGLLAALRDLLARAGGLLGRGRGGTRGRRLEPFARLNSLEKLPPEDAVRAAFGRWLDLVELHGRARPEGDTALDVMRALPRSLQGLAATAGRLTLIYQRVAYGTQPATERDREDALGVLRELRDALNRAEAA
jgi:hypothetical protein